MAARMFGRFTTARLLIDTVTRVTKCHTLRAPSEFGSGLPDTPRIGGRVAAVRPPIKIGDTCHRTLPTRYAR